MKVLLLLLLTFAGTQVYATYPAAPSKTPVQSQVDDPQVKLTDGTVHPYDAPTEAPVDQYSPPKHLANNVRRARYNVDIKHTFIYPPSALPTNAPASHPTTEPTRSPTKVPSKQPTRQPTKRASPISRPAIKSIRSSTKQPTRQPTKHPTNAPTQQQPCPKGINFRLQRFFHC
jgi:hypothetical protein